MSVVAYPENLLTVMTFNELSSAELLRGRDLGWWCWVLGCCLCAKTPRLLSRLLT